jgi:hypothetical protein
MNKQDARKIAEIITNQQLDEMFNMAKISITDWTKVSSVNKGMTKGVNWNILAKDFDINDNYHILAKTNMIWEFGDYLPDNLKIKHKKRVYPKPVHHEPQF